jgi:arginase
MDLYDGTTSPTGEAADMPIAALLGRGPAAWSERVAPVPVVGAPAVALMGFRDATELADLEQQLANARADGLLALSEPDIRAAGLTESAWLALDHVGRACDRLWLHIDLDVLGETVFPATDYPMPGGFDWDELVMLLEPIVEASGLVGWSLACYNPDKDPDRRNGRAIVRSIGRLFG